MWNIGDDKINVLVGQLLGLSVCRSANKPFDNPANQSINQSIHNPAKQSTKQFNQPNDVRSVYSTNDILYKRSNNDEHLPPYLYIHIHHIHHISATYEWVRLFVYMQPSRAKDFICAMCAMCDDDANHPHLYFKVQSLSTSDNALIVF